MKITFIGGGNMAVALIGGGLPTPAEDQRAMERALPSLNDVPAGSRTATADELGFDPTDGAGAYGSCSGSAPRRRAAAQTGFANEAKKFFGGVFAMSFEDEAEAATYYEVALENLDCVTDQMDLPPEIADSVKITHERTTIEGADAAESVTARIVLTEVHMLVALDGRHVVVAFSSGADQSRELVGATVDEL